MRTEHFPDIYSVDIEALNPYEFEYFCAEYLQARSWDAEVMGKSGDQGVDVVAKKRGTTVAIQCKKYSSAVGNSAVQEVYSGRLHYNADIAVVVSNAGFTKAAQELAKSTSVKLISVYELSSLDKYVKNTETTKSRKVKPYSFDEPSDTEELDNFLDNFHKNVNPPTPLTKKDNYHASIIKGEISKLISNAPSRKNTDILPYELNRGGKIISLKSIIHTHSSRIIELGQTLGIDILNYPWLAAYIYFDTEYKNLRNHYSIDEDSLTDFYLNPKTIACLELICDYGVSIGHLELGRLYGHLYDVRLHQHLYYTIPQDYSGESHELHDLGKKKDDLAFLCWNKGW